MMTHLDLSLFLSVPSFLFPIEQSKEEKWESSADKALAEPVAASANPSLMWN